METLGVIIRRCCANISMVYQHVCQCQAWATVPSKPKRGCRSAGTARQRTIITFAGRIRYEITRWPWLHRPLRWLSRKTIPAVTERICETVRNIIPSSVRFGLPRGCFSAYELLCQNKPPIEGRVILTDQGSPKLPARSMMVLCRRNQHGFQPWPIFCSHHRNARLVGSTLVHVN